VAFYDADNGWAVGDGRGVVYTSDGGDTWSIVTAPTSPSHLNAVVALSPTSAIAVGDAGTMRALTATTDTARSSGTGNPLYGITFADANHGWAVGENATIMKSTNGGASWTTATRPLPNGFTAGQLKMRSVAFANAYDGIIVSSYQMVWRTHDAGASWEPDRITYRYDTEELRGVAFAGSAEVPVAVSRPYDGLLATGDDKAVAFKGSWTDLGPHAPFAPSDVLAVDGSPRPRVTVSWTDNSSDEDGFEIERSAGSASGPWSPLTTRNADVTSYTDSSVGWTTTYYYRVRSFAGGIQSAWAVSGPFVADDVAPTTTSDVESSYVESATVEFEATDNPGGSGLAHTYSTVDGSNQQDGLFRTITGFGPHTLAYWSVDVAGKTETPHVFQLYIADPSIPDTTAPVTRVTSPQTYYANFAPITLAATDVGSGVGGTFYRLDGGSQVESSSVRVTGAGTHTLRFWSIDLQGHEETQKTFTFTVVTPPSTGGFPSKPTAPLSMRRGVAFTSYGYIIRHTAGTSPVTLRFYRYKSGKYVYYKSVTAKVSNVLGFSRYYRGTSVPYAGKWRVRAVHNVGTTKRPKYLYSSYTNFTAT
jgi:hypothetical protein